MKSVLFVRIIDSKILFVHQTTTEFMINLVLPSQEYFGSSPLVMHAVRPTRREAVFNHVQEYTPLDYTASRWTGHW
jgi:hypothetical protein